MACNTQPYQSLEHQEKCDLPQILSHGPQKSGLISGHFDSGLTNSKEMELISIPNTHKDIQGCAIEKDSQNIPGDSTPDNCVPGQEISERIILKEGRTYPSHYVNNVYENNLQEPISFSHPSDDDDHQDTSSFKDTHSIHFTCSVCSKPCSTPGDLERHKICHSGEPFHCCHRCVKGFRTLERLTRHMVFHENLKEESRVHKFENLLDPRSYKVEKGQDVLGRKEKSICKIKKRNSKVQKQYECPECGAKFSCKYKKMLHLQKHPKKQDHHACAYCDRSFKYKGSLKRHTMNHTGKPYRCQLCDGTFISEQRLRVHMMSHTGERPHKCTVCDRAFKIEHQLTRHMRTHTGEKPYACKYCDRKFRLSEYLVKHERTHTGEKPYQCPICDKKFATVSARRSHVRTHTGEKAHRCSECGRGFAAKKSLESHSCLRCEVCEKMFPTLESLELHKKTHTGYLPFKCTVCGEAYNRRDTLDSHMKIHLKGVSSTENGKNDTLPSSNSEENGKDGLSSVKNVDIQCAYCRMDFSNCDSLRDHVKTHTKGEIESVKEKRIYKCAECDCVYRRMCDLKDHLKIHAGVRSHLCEFCGDGFFRKRQMDEHVTKVHTGVYKYTCTECDKGFLRTSELKVHMITTHDKGGVRKTYSCELCGKSYLQAHGLEYHVLTAHASSGTQVCVLCETSFDDINSLKEHEKDMHVGKGPFSCKKCKQEFKHLSQIKRHLTIHKD